MGYSHEDTVRQDFAPKGWALLLPDSIGLFKVQINQRGWENKNQIKCTNNQIINIRQ